jgi:hypothetical protein
MVRLLLRTKETKNSSNRKLGHNKEEPWFVPNTIILRVLETLTVNEEIHRYSSQYSAGLSAQQNGLSEPYGVRWQQQVIAEATAKR